MLHTYKLSGHSAATGRRRGRESPVWWSMAGYMNYKGRWIQMITKPSHLGLCSKFVAILNYIRTYLRTEKKDRKETGQRVRWAETEEEVPNRPFYFATISV